MDFGTSQEATTAFNSLRSAHLYGRHLVLEWAKEGMEEDLTSLRKRASNDLKAIQAENKRKKLDESSGGDFMNGGQGDSNSDDEDD